MTNVVGNATNACCINRFSIIAYSLFFFSLYISPDTGSPFVMLIAIINTDKKIK